MLGTSQSTARTMPIQDIALPLPTLPARTRPAMPKPMASGMPPMMPKISDVTAKPFLAGGCGAVGYPTGPDPWPGYMVPCDAPGAPAGDPGYGDPPYGWPPYGWAPYGG